MEYPDDDNGSVLQSMKDAGMDMGREYPIEFWHVFSDEASAQAMLQDAEAIGVQGELFDNSEELEDDDSDDEDMEPGEGFDVLCIVPMVPTHESVTAMESKLASLAERHGGNADGWGVYNEEAIED